MFAPRHAFECLTHSENFDRRRHVIAGHPNAHARVTGVGQAPALTPSRRAAVDARVTVPVKGEMPEQ